MKGGEIKKITTQTVSNILGLGIDISKNKANICLKEDSKVLENFIVTNDEKGITTLLDRIESYLVENKYLIKVAIESTGNLWINMYEKLEQYNKRIEVSLANPLKTKAIAEAKIKYDKLDASILADLARADLIAKCYVPDNKTREMRSLVRHRIDLAQRRTQLKNKIHNILDKYLIRYKGDLFSHSGLQWLYTTTINNNNNNNNKTSIIDKQILNSHLKEILTINDLIADTEKEMAKIAIKDKRVDLLLGFTGIDYYGALLLLYEIGDITRFSNPKKLVSWVGLSPSLYQSGNITRTGSITRQGNARIRWFLVEAALMAARYDPKMKIFYERILKKKGNQKARVAVARKMLVSIYHVLTRNELYHGHRQDVQLRKIKNMNRVSRK